MRISNFEIIKVDGSHLYKLATERRPNIKQLALFIMSTTEEIRAEKSTDDISALALLAQLPGRSDNIALMKDMTIDEFNTLARTLYILEIDNAELLYPERLDEAPVNRVSLLTAATCKTPTCSCRLCTAIRYVKAIDTPSVLDEKGHPVNIHKASNGCMVPFLSKLNWQVTYGSICKTIAKRSKQDYEEQERREKEDEGPPPPTESPPM